MQFLKRFPYLPAVVFFLITVVLLTYPGSRFPKSHLFDIPFFDKWVHVGLFGILCFLFSIPLVYSPIPFLKKKQWFLFILLMGILYGVAMEFVQKYWAINRSFDEWDMVADSVGSFLAILVSFQILKRTNPGT